MLATNVAETSLTVPGIRYVVDAGTARISRYSARTKVQRLPIEPISQASANQRAGRCGRVAPGVCIRLYSEEDFLGRPEFTEPEILRTNLASVILQMAAADLGDIAAFPFVEPPDRSQITDGLRLLEELGALADDTVHGRSRPERAEAAPGRAEADRDRAAAGRHPGRPADGPDAARRGASGLPAGDVGHRLRAVDPGPAGAAAPSSASGPTPCTAGSGRRPRPPRPTPNTAARTPGRSPTAATSWPAAALGLRPRRSAPPVRQRVPTAVPGGVPALPADPGVAGPARPAQADQPRARAEPQRRPGRCRPGSTPPRWPGCCPTSAWPTSARTDGQAGRRRAGPARGSTWAPEAPGSRSTPARAWPGRSRPLVVAAEIVETTRLWARTVAAITAEQVEEVGQHLLKRQYSEPHWSARAGSVLAYEQVSLYGVPIVARRPVAYGRINPAEARDIFIRSALVEGQWRTRHHFFARQPGAAGGGRGAGGADPASRPGGRRRRRSWPSTTPGYPATSPRPPTSTRGGRRPGSRRRTC